MKNILFSTVFLYLSLSVNAQPLQVKDLSSSVGSWEGKLTYLDYSSGKPFTMSANINIGLTADNLGYVMGYEYPNEPHANMKDTTFIVGNFFGNEKIVEFERYLDGEYKMITEVVGNDGNDHKKGVLRHTYLLKSNTFSVMKEVKFDGTDKWIKRNEYLLNRISNE